MTFQKGNQLGKNQTNQRRDTTIELIAQLNEHTTRKGGKKTTKLKRMISNLIAKATDAFDVLDASGAIIKEGTGDLAAITEIMNRIDGKPSQKLVGPDDGPVQDPRRMCRFRNQPRGCVNNMPFQKGNQLAKGNQYAKNSTNQRRDTTIELIAQLNEETTRIGGKKNTKLQRMIADTWVC